MNNLFNPLVVETKRATYSFSKKIKSIYELSKVGYSGPNILKINQDNMFVFNNLANNPDFYFLGVCDGHGLYGHEISKYIKENLPTDMNLELSRKKEPKNVHNNIIEQIFLNLNFKLLNVSNIDTTFSGSTCVSLLCTPENLKCANIGDSRAVLGRFVKGSKS